jgi:hypothetical protein
VVAEMAAREAENLTLAKALELKRKAPGFRGFL